MVLQGSKGSLLLQAIPKMMTIKLENKCEALLKEMLSKNSRFGSAGDVVNEAWARYGQCFVTQRGRECLDSASRSNSLFE